MERDDTYSSPNNIMVIKSRRTCWARHLARMVQMRNLYKILIVKCKRTLVRHTYQWESHHKMDTKETVCDGLDWIHLNQDRIQWRTLISTVMNLRVP